MLKRRPSFAAVVCTAWLAVAAVAAVALSGCTTDGTLDLRESLAVYERESEALDAAIADAEARLADQPPGEERDKVVAVIADAEAEKAEVDAIIRRVATAIESADQSDPVDLAGNGILALGSVLGPYAVIGGTLLLSLNEWRKRRRTEGAVERVVTAIDRAKTDGVVNFRDPTTEAKLRAGMGTDGQKLVEKYRGY